MTDHVTKRKPLHKLVGAGLGVLAAATCLVGSGSGRADPPVTPQETGTYHKGQLTVPLHRGAAVPFEVSVMTTPENCTTEPTLTLDWDEQADTVNVHLEGHHVLTPYPTVTRTEGVDFVPNPFLVQTQNVVNGRYLLWVVAGGGPQITFYYDPTTLDLLGSTYDFPTPPAGAIPLVFPSLRLTATDFFQPDADGNLDFDWTFQYSNITRGNLPFSHYYVTFPPPNLCGADPYRFDLSTLRPYFSPAQPLSDAVPWTDYIQDGLLFDVTTEPATFFTYPPTVTLIASYSGATVVGGTVPRGWTLDFDAAFGNVAPPIRPWDGAGSCTQVYKPIHTQNLDFCAPQ